MLLIAGCGGGSIVTGVPLGDAGEPASDAQADGAQPGRDGGADANGGGGDASGSQDSSAVAQDSGQSGGDVDSSSGSADAAGGEAGGADSSGPDTSGTVPVFVAMGYGTRRIMSYDYGVTWVNDTAADPNGGDDGTLVRGLGGGGGKFVAAVGAQGTQNLFTSEDGKCWTRLLRSGNEYNGYSDVVFGNGRFVAGGGHVSSVSVDGYTWGMEGTMGSGGILRRLAFGDYMGGRFVAVGSSGRRMNSQDGITWGAEVEEGPELIGVAFGAGVFVAISHGQDTRYSADGGATWEAQTIPSAVDVRGILYDGRRFIVTTAGNTFTSDDGRSWASHTASGGPESFDVSDDGQHYAGSKGDVLYESTDGIHFTVRDSGGQAFVEAKFQRVKPAPSLCPPELWGDPEDPDQ